MLVSGLALAGAVAFLLVYSHVVLAQRQFAIDNLNTQVQQQQVAYQKLRLQVAQLGSPQQIISTAEGRLGMTQPASGNYLPTNTTTSGSPASQSSFGSTATSTIAPEGDADWPLIKSQLAGSP
jgi:cell division protein FtsL